MIGRVLENERKLLVALCALVVLLNIPYGGYVLYPFMLFSTWVHELCHGLAAVAVGGRVEWLKLFPDGSGLALTSHPESRLLEAWVASAGYVGTATVGATMLSLRRLPWAGRPGVMAVGLAMLASAVVWVRNPFGLAVVLLLGVGLVVAARRLSRARAGELFTFLAATCCLNALTSIRVLFGGQSLSLDGQPIQHSDAHAVADALLLPSWVWAGGWMLLTLGLVLLALRIGAPKSS